MSIYFLAITAIGYIGLVKWAIQNLFTTTKTKSLFFTDTVIDALKELHVKGELTIEEFEQMSQRYALE